MKHFTKPVPSLQAINEQRARMGLEPLAVNPIAMRPGKTAKQNKKAQNANRAARAAANQAMKTNRQRKGK